MTFTESFRVERVYFEKLKNNITDIKNLLAAGNTEDARILLENSVDVDGAVLLLYRNLGECWAELADQIKKTRDELDALKEATEAYHDELNEKIDNLNFVLLRLINALDARLTVVENDLSTMPRVKFLSLVYDETESAYSIQNPDGETVSFEDVSEMAEFPHFIVLTDADGKYYMPEEYTDSGFMWHIDKYNTTVDAYSDISVILASDDSVTVSESTLPKLSAGYGIEINSDEEIEIDTSAVQEKLIAGQNITLTPDSTDPTKTVIDAAGGGSTFPDVSVNMSSSKSLRFGNVQAGFNSYEFPATGKYFTQSSSSTSSLSESNCNGILFEAKVLHSDVVVTDPTQTNEKAKATIYIKDAYTVAFKKDSVTKTLVFDRSGVCLMSYHYNSSNNLTMSIDVMLDGALLDISGMISKGYKLTGMTAVRNSFVAMTEVPYSDTRNSSINTAEILNELNQAIYSISFKILYNS